MSSLEMVGALGAVALAAGTLGALTGLGGGVVITPVLTLLFGIDIRYAIGTTLVAVIATSSGAAAAYVKEGFSNIRLGVFLEIGTTLGALVGAHAATAIPTSALAVIFGVVLLYSAWASHFASTRQPRTQPPDPLAARLRLDSSFPTPQGLVRYHVQRVKTGLSLMFGAGMISGMLGIGSGALKVLAMDQAMGIPFKVSTTTSNFMIGVTAAASAGVYLKRGYIDPVLTMPITVGVLVGAVLGARILPGAPIRTLRVIFGVVVSLMALQMIYSGLRGRL